MGISEVIISATDYAALQARITALEADLASARAEAAKFRSAVVKSQWALQPFADGVFRDNGDLTVSVPNIEPYRIREAYWAYRACRAALATPAKED